MLRTAVFFCRDIPENWPADILWTNQSKSVSHFKYHENELTWSEKKSLYGDANKLSATNIFCHYRAKEDAA